MKYYEAPENVKYHGGYDPSNPPQYEEDDEPDNDTPYRLSDEGRSFGFGESYSERNT